MHRYQQKALIQVASYHKQNDITDPVKYVCKIQKLFNPAIGAKTVRHAHPALQMTRLNWIVMSIDASVSNEPCDNRGLQTLHVTNADRKVIIQKTALDLLALV